MEEKKSKEEDENKKPLNIVLLGESISEKEKLITKLLLSNSQKPSSEIDIKKEEDKEEDKSLIQNIIHCVEMNGEKIKMKIWDNPSTEEFLSPSIKIAQGILLFYSIKNRQSFEKIKQDLSKIIELGRFDIPIVIIGNHSDTNKREVSYEEGKSFADSYGLRFYETSFQSGVTIEKILQDIGEQLVFQECINTANNSKINIDNDNDIINEINNDNDINNLNVDDFLNLDDNLNIGEIIESKNKKNYKSAHSNKDLKNTFDQELSQSLTDSNIFNSDNNIKKNKSNKQITKFSLFNSNSTTNIKKNKKPINLKNKNSVNKSGSLILNEKNSNFGNYSHFNLLNKNKNSFKKNNNSISLTSKTNQTSLNSSLNYSASSKNIHSYLKKTAITKHREKETKENKIKMEKEFHSIGAQREREGLELKKKKILEEKQIYIKKIKEDKILQKEKEKNKKEEEIKKAKNKYEKIKKEKEEIDREIKREKEKDKINKIINKQNEKEKINKLKEKLNKEREKEIENVKIKKEKEKEKEKERIKEIEKIKEEKGKEHEKDKEKLKEEKLLKEKEQEEKNKLLFLKIKDNKEKNAEKNKEKTLSKKKSQKDILDNKNINISNFDILNNNVIIKSKNNLSNKIEKEKINKNNKEKEKETKDKKEEIRKIESEKEKELIAKIAIKEEIKNKYLNNPNVYRCLKCNLIPKININEYNQEIEVICDHSYYNNLHHNIINYKNFQIKSLNHSFKDNIFCSYCNKSLNQLNNEDMIYYCKICNLYYCSNDELNHKNHKHQNDINIKTNYKSIFNNNKNNKINNEPLRRRGSIGKINSNINNIINISSTRRLSFKNNSIRRIKEENKEIINNENNENKENENNKNNNKNINSEKIINIKKFPIYLMDTYCFIHDEIFNSYCHSCHKNICHICQIKEHERHNIENFDDIFLNEEELSKKKLEISIVKENLLKINDYFIALIEAIKCRFEKLYKFKQKEIEIKEKIINDYEIIKYNYNCIKNIKNLNIDNKQSFINSTNNIDWLSRLNLIFEYLNNSLISTNNDIFKKINNLNNNNNNNNIEIVNLGDEKIKNIINLYNDYFCISNTKGELKIFNYDKFKEKLKIKLFNEGEGINNMIKLENGLIGCCGYEKIKFIQMNLYNDSYSINKIFEEKYNNFFSLIEFNNNYFISSGSNKKLQLWINEKNILNKNNIDLSEIIGEDEDINMLYKIYPFSFLCCLVKSKKIIKYSIKRNNEIKFISKLENISVIKGNNSLLNLSSNKNILLIAYKNSIKDFGIIIVDNNKFEIISKIQSIIPFCYINYLENENIITIDKKGIIQKWKYVEADKKLYECDKINEPLNNYNNNLSKIKKLKSFISINNYKSFIFQYKNGITYI